MADQLTLIQGGGQIIPTTLLPAPLHIFGQCGVPESRKKKKAVGEFSSHSSTVPSERTKIRGIDTNKRFLVGKGGYFIFLSFFLGGGNCTPSVSDGPALVVTNIGHWQSQPFFEY